MENTNDTVPNRAPPYAPAPLLLPELLTTNPVTKTPTKKRSFSDSTPVLGPSPKFSEGLSLKTRDDESILATPSRAPKRASLSSRGGGGGLHLQMPARDPTIFSYQNPGLRAAQSPQSEFEPVYGSPSSVLPRHSRGLDFSRACTNLHHSTLAEQSSPDSSPTITQKGFRPPSRRNSMYSMIVDSPRLSYSTIFSGSLNNERQFVPRSVGSTNAMTSEASSSSSDEDDMSILQDEPDDTMIATPYIRRSEGGGSISSTPFAAPIKGADAPAWSMQSPAPNAFINYRKNMLTRRHSRRSRDSWNSRSRTASPDGSAAIPNTSTTNNTGPESHTFAPTNQDQLMRSPPSRRDSLSVVVGNGLHITSSNESGDENAFNLTPMTPGVVRRPVTRRSNMLPKSKNFARIRAALQEEAAPVDCEARRESEVVRQVRVKDVGLKGLTPIMPPSPDLTPSVPNLTHDSSEMSEIEALSAKGGYEGPPKTDEEPEKFSTSPKDFAHKLQDKSKTPPPSLPPLSNLFRRHRSSSGISEDASMDSPFSSTPPSSTLSSSAAATATAAAVGQDTIAEQGSSAQFQTPALPSLAEITRKAHNKRRRDDEFDPNSIKRRAVSPGVSVHNSPILGQSPASGHGAWGRSSKSSASEKSSGGSGNEEKPSSAATTTGHVTPVLGPTRVGLQGMADTSDGLMNMSIE